MSEVKPVQNSVFKKCNFAFVRFWVLVFCGVFAALIFPPFKNMAVGWASLILFLAYLFYQKRPKKAMFWRAYIFGAAFFVMGFSWINNALLVDADKLAVFIPLVILAVGAFFGLFWAIPAVVVAERSSIYCRMLGFAAGYVIMEWVRSFIFTGFPWNLLGTALSFDLHLVQGAAYIGTYGLSFLFLLVCEGIALLLLSVVRRKIYKGAIFLIVLPMLFIGVAAQRLNSDDGSNVNKKDGFIVRLVQPSIPQSFKWNPQRMEDNFQQYIKMSQKGKEEGYVPLDEVRMVVWGETATPYFLDRDEYHLSEIKAAIPQGGFLVTGVLRLTMEQGKVVPYNSLFVLDDNGDIKDYYDKAHLVPFGEYLPFREYLPEFMRPVADIVGDLGKGEKYKNIRVKGLPLMGGAICYESIFPKEVLNPTEKPEVLLVLANDGWYGISAGPYQHLTAAQMRAIEEGITIIRSGNNGISAVIAPKGEIKAQIGLDKVGVIDVSLNYPLSLPTFYGQWGNAMPLGLILIVLLFCLRPRKVSPKK